MATAGDIANRALKRILVGAADSGLAADESADFLDAMNDYMAALESRNLVLGYTPVSNVADEVTVPSGAIRGIVANLAIEVAPDYGAVVSAELLRQAKEGMAAMRKLGQPVIQASLPQTLPIGSGNHDLYLVSEFYGSQAYARLSLAGNDRETELAATSTKYRVTGFWGVDKAKALMGDINGTVTNIGATELDLNVELTLSAVGSGNYTFHIMKNGVSQKSVAAALTTTASSVTTSKMIEVGPGDYIEIWVEGDSTNSVTVQSAQFTVS